MKILICDDSMMIRRQLKNMILNLGDYEVCEASNGEIAIETYKEEKPNLVYMDIIMPKLDGVGAVDKIIKFDPKAQIVMLSSVGTKENLSKAIKVGAVDFIQKPVEEEVLKNTINKFSKGV
jgi:two-component system chemotaxis response regulator CheY